MQCDTNNGVLHFKSIPEYYTVERRGAKANTLRVVTQAEYDTIMSYVPETVTITLVGTGESFTREISSIIRIRPSIGVSVEHGNVLVLVSWWA